MTDNKKLEDFGEHIAGAKKETYFKAVDLANEGTKKLPLSKLWANKDIMAIKDPQISAIAYALKDGLPNKPRQDRKLNDWLVDLQSRQEFVIDLLEKDDQNYTIQKIDSIRDDKIKNKSYLLAQLDKDDWKSIGKLYFYQKINLGNNIHFDVIIDNKLHTFLPKDPASIHNYNSKAIINEFAQEIQNQIEKNKQDKSQNDTKGKKLTAQSFDIYTYKKDNTAFICYKNDRQKTPLIEFETLAEAREYKKDPENIAELGRRWTAHREQNSITKADMRNKTNEERTGQSYRDQDITPDEFMTTFGVRGGQFGNWVTGDERQAMLNNAYDGFMDLSKALKIEPKAIGLNGTLGIAFGARGSGNASAHYERGEQVINLTKTRGAGSLAHEWWHALDHYLKNGDELLTRHLNQSSTARHQELITPVRELIKDIHKSELYERSQTADAYRSPAYFSADVEMTARAFEGYIQHTLSKMGIKNDFLVNIRAEKDWQKNLDAYPYPKAEELEPLGKAYNAIFDTLKEVDKEFVPAHYEPEQIIHADTLAVDDTKNIKENLEPSLKNQENNSLNIIAKNFSNDPASKEVQDRVMALAQKHPQELIKVYTEMSSTFNGRYIASDMMKEVFDDFSQSPAHRNQFNNAVHNTAATLSALHFEQMINEPVINGRDTVVFLTGCPGAGKTSSVMNSNTLKQNVGVVFEGQLANAHQNPATIEKIQQALDKGFKVEIIAVNPLPEQALENTFKRYYDPNDGRGASISTMARIQGNTFDGLKAIHDRFGDKVELHIVDKPDGNKNTIKYAGWQHLDVLKSQGTEAEIAKRLETHLINHYAQGEIDYDCLKQSAGSEERAKQLLGSRVVERVSESERENGNGREIPSGSSQENNAQQGRSSIPVSQAHTPNLKPTLEQIQERVAQAQQALNLNKETSNADQTQAHHTEQRAIHQAPTIDSRTTSRVDSLQSARSQVLQGSNQDTQQSHQSLSDKPTYIKCPYSEKNEAKALGAKWDGDNKLWYVPAGLDLTKFEKWLTPNRQTSQSKPQTTTATQPDERIYLYTQPSDNDALQQLKRQGIIKFDPPLKLWYANKSNAEAVKQWTIRPNVPTAEQALGEHLRNLGINVEAGHPIIDGRPHRLANDGSKDKNVMYHAYPNDGGVPYARITNFSRGGVSEWTYPTEHLLVLKAIEAVDRATGKKTAPSKTNHQPTQSSYTKQASQTTPKDAALENKMAERAKMLMSFAPIAPSTQKYLNDKKVTANDVARIVPSSDQIPKELEPFIAIGNTPSQYFWLQSNNPESKLVLQRGSLVIPQTNAQGEIRAFETIAYNGKKYAQKDAQKSGLSTALGHLKNGNPIVIAEGYATGATLHENTGQAVVVAFGKNGLMHIAQELRGNFPDSKIYIGADNDHNKTLNAGLLDAKAVEKAIPNTYVLVPTFNQGDTGKDWNDVFVDKGVDEFKRQLKEQLAVINPQQAQSNKTVQNQVQPAPTQNPLDPDSIRQNHPTMSDDNIKSVQLWQKEIARRYAEKPHHQALALERLVNKLSDYANGEILTPPKSYMAKMQPQKATPEQPQTKPSQDSQTQVATNKSTTR